MYRKRTCFVQGLERIFADGVQEGSTFWDFVEHSQHTMAEDDRRRYNNPNAKEQVTEVLAQSKTVKWDGVPNWQGRLWLVLCLNTHSLLDAVTSLAAQKDIKMAYYSADAFLAQEANFRVFYSLLNQLHKLKFKLFMSDMRYFDQIEAIEAVTCGRRGIVCLVCPRQAQ